MDFKKMKTKEELITKMYGDFVGINDNIIEVILSNNGWMPKVFLPPTFDKNLFDIHENYARPKSLRGIEDNNGWTKINHRFEMPDYDCMIRVCFEGKPDKAIYQWEHKSSLMHVVDGLYVSQNSYKYRFYNPNTSHYKIVELDKEPLY